MTRTCFGLHVDVGVDIRNAQRNNKINNKHKTWHLYELLPVQGLESWSFVGRSSMGLLTHLAFETSKHGVPEMYKRSMALTENMVIADLKTCIDGNLRSVSYYQILSDEGRLKTYCRAIPLVPDPSAKAPLYWKIGWNQQAPQVMTS